jgi:hypothetical protein
MTDKWIMKYLKQNPDIETFDELLKVSKHGWVHSWCIDWQSQTNN